MAETQLNKYSKRPYKIKRCLTQSKNKKSTDMMGCCIDIVLPTITHKSTSDGKGTNKKQTIKHT